MYIAMATGTSHHPDVMEMPSFPLYELMRKNGQLAVIIGSEPPCCQVTTGLDPVFPV